MFYRWDIEKEFNNYKSNLKETKAWSSNYQRIEKSKAPYLNDL